MPVLAGDMCLMASHRARCCHQHAESTVFEASADEETRARTLPGYEVMNCFPYFDHPRRREDSSDLHRFVRRFHGLSRSLGRRSIGDKSRTSTTYQVHTYLFALGKLAHPSTVLFDKSIVLICGKKLHEGTVTAIPGQTC